MSVQNPNRVVTKQDLADFYQGILPYLGGMPEMLANKFSKGDMYSTDEKMIGQWIDGKPLYQRVLNKTISASSNVGNVPNGTTDIYQGNISISSDIPNIDVGMVDISHSYYMVDSASRGFMGAWYEKDTGNIWFSTLYERTNVSATFTITYTKSTDSAVSIGNDTDYSTTEKIVGTWIDNEPIWQKTWSLNTVLPASSASPNHVNITLQDVGTLNIENVVGYTVCVKGKGDHYTGSYLTTDGSGSNIRSFLNVSNGYVQVSQTQTSYADQFTVIACTVQYTKTS